MPRRSQAPAANAAGLPNELAKIRRMSVDEARSQWLSITGAPTSRELSGDMLRRMIAHRLQERVLGGLDRKIESMLDRMAEGTKASMPFRPKPGSVLVREHNGVLHQVMVLGDAFAWNGQTHQSLSAVAKAITGTSWNGHRFFGIERKKPRRHRDDPASTESEPSEVPTQMSPELAGRDELVPRSGELYPTGSLT